MPVHRIRPHPSPIRTDRAPQPPGLKGLLLGTLSLPNRFSSTGGSVRPPTPDPPGVGGLNRPAATAADPEKAGARTQRERVERSPNITERNVQLFPNCHLKSPWGNEPVRFVPKGGAFFPKQFYDFLI